MSDLTVKILSTTKDYFGVWEVEVLVNNVVYTYPISSEYLLRKVEKLIRLKHPGKALHVLQLAKISGFNYYTEEARNGLQQRRSTECSCNARHKDEGGTCSTQEGEV